MNEYITSWKESKISVSYITSHINDNPLWQFSLSQNITQLPLLSVFRDTKQIWQPILLQYVHSVKLGSVRKLFRWGSVLKLPACSIRAACQIASKLPSLKPLKKLQNPTIQHSQSLCAKVREQRGCQMLSQTFSFCSLHFGAMVCLYSSREFERLLLHLLLYNRQWKSFECLSELLQYTFFFLTMSSPSNRRLNRIEQT